jgi:glycosyltransferase involved in cell wall biosynthesis
MFVTEDWYFLMHWVAPLAEARANGIDVRVITGPGSKADAVAAHGFPHDLVPLSRRSRNPVRELITLVSLARLYRSQRPDVVHHIALKPILYGTIAASLAGVPRVVNTFAGLGYMFTEGGLFKRVARWFVLMLLRVTCSGSRVIITCQNQDDRRLLLQKSVIREDRCIVIAGVGIDLKEFHPTEETDGGRVVLFPGRLLWDKGVGDLVEASRILRRKSVPVEVVLAGEPDPENPASIPVELVRQWERDGLVKWVGRQSDMASLYHRANIVCVPSYREGLSRSLIEAACSGRAAVTTDVPGCRDIVVNRFNGLIVPPRCPKELAEALMVLLEYPSLRKVMGENGHKRVRQYFASEVVLPMYVALYSTGKYGI